MCGIFCSLCRNDYILPDSQTEQLLRNRGPDSTGTHQTIISTLATPETSAKPLHATFLSTVLSLRGCSVVDQPIRDESTGSVLCWNGEAWRIGDHLITGNDSQHVFNSLINVAHPSSQDDKTSSIERVISIIEAIRGPFALVFYDAVNQHVYYGRDCLGRRSLLRKTTRPDTLVLSSVCDNASGNEWEEVEADGIYVVDLACSAAQQPLTITHIPQRRAGLECTHDQSLTLPFPFLNKAIPVGSHGPSEEDVDGLAAELGKALELRVQHVRESIETAASNHMEAKVAILFSGGLDCTVLARLSHDLLPLTEGIDLLNVAFENPRIHKDLDPGISPYELCPDRITGRASCAELRRVCPGRQWQFVEINVPYKDTIAHRAQVTSLMHPHNTEMDLSISYALYFASRGSGLFQGSFDGPHQPYATPAHVLLSGLGADELFGGYQRHATAYSRQGYPGLINELELDFDRLGKRNLGRDDRVISDSGKEVRFPYLDEDFIARALSLPVWAKCDFGNQKLPEDNNPARFLEPGKRILRLLAWKLDMKGVAAEKKRAIQFGARTAKMETGKTKGTSVLS